MKSLEEMRVMYPDVCISKCVINKIDHSIPLGTPGSTTGQSSMYILYGGFGNSNPKAYMDSVVASFVEKDMYNEFVESTLDNPWSRIIICEINNLLN